MATAGSYLSHSIAIPASIPRHSCRLFWREGQRLGFTIRIQNLSVKTVSKVQASSVFVVAQEEINASVRDIPSLKSDLLSMVAGLDRGLLARENDQVNINAIAEQLEGKCGPVKLGDSDSLQGRWRLVYSSAFASGSLGGMRPGPPAGASPFTLGQVYQRIDVFAKELDNIVELRLRTLWPLPPIVVEATLAHSYEVIGDNVVKIVFEKTLVKPKEGLEQVPPFTLPQLPEFLRPSAGLRSGTFECTFLDQNMRITRGDRGELRIFVMA